jgi:hypothetical protein
MPHLARTVTMQRKRPLDLGGLSERELDAGTRRYGNEIGKRGISQAALIKTRY